MKMINIGSSPYRIFTVMTPRGEVETGSLNQLRKIIKERLSEGIEKDKIIISKVEGTFEKFRIE